MLEVRSLTKRFHSIPAVQEVSFTARDGEVTGLLGPNGSGKSTTFRMITGLIAPDGGDILYRGQPAATRPMEFKALLGYVPEEPNLYTHLTGAEYLELIGRLRGIPDTRLQPKIEQFLRLFSLWGDRYTAISEYSKGMKQKVLIAAALLHNPSLIILDEPFVGLDVSSTLVLRSLIRALAADGKVVLFSSHVLEVVEKVCSEVIILYKGRVAASGSIETLRELAKVPTLEDVFAQVAVEQNTESVSAGLMEVIRL